MTEAVFWVVVMGYAPLGGAIGVLYRDLKKERAERISDKAEHNRVLAELYSIVRENKEETKHE